MPRTISQDPALVPLVLLTKFFDAVQGEELELAQELGRRIMELEPTNKLVNDHLPTVEMKLKLLAAADDGAWTGNEPRGAR